MERFWKYLEDEPTGFRAVKYILFWSFIFEFYFCFTIFHAYHLAALAFIGWKKILWRFFSAAAEEMIFRAAPFDFAFIFFRKKEKIFRASILFCWLLFSFLLFGPLHMFVGEYRETFLVSIVAQGALGLMLAKIYLKCGGIRGKMLKPLVICVLIHFAHNIYAASALYIKIS